MKTHPNLRIYTDQDIDNYFYQETKVVSEKYRDAIRMALSQSFGIRMKWGKHYILNGWSHYLTQKWYSYFVDILKERYISNKIKELFEKEDWDSLDKYLSKGN